MNRSELVEALSAAGVDPRAYAVQGCPSGAGLAEGGVLLAQDDTGRWILGSRERGVVTVERYFGSEEEACGYLYGDLTRPRPPRQQLTPEEEAESREITERRVAEYRRAIEERLAQHPEDS